MLAEIPVNITTGAATAAKGVIAAPTDNADPTIPTADPTSPIDRNVPANESPLVTAPKEPFAANAITAPVAAPATPLPIESK